MVYEQFNLEKKNFILKRFKIKVFKTLENQSWIEVPKNWQLLLSNGFNIVWNNLEHNKFIKNGESIWVVTRWKKTIIHSEPQNPFDHKEIEKVKFEPRVYVDINQNEEIIYENIQSTKNSTESFMNEMWKKYLKTNDIEYLAKASEKAPFFGQKEMSIEIAKKLRGKKE